MNFLSHFYFDRNTTDPHQVIGMVLPDLLKNANKEIPNKRLNMDSLRATQAKIAIIPK